MMENTEKLTKEEIQELELLYELDKESGEWFPGFWCKPGDADWE